MLVAIVDDSALVSKKDIVDFLVGELGPVRPEAMVRRARRLETALLGRRVEYSGAATAGGHLAA
jgi:hypothetical protein